MILDDDKVNTTLVPDCRKPLLRAMVRGRIAMNSMPVDGWHGCDALVDAEYPRPLVIGKDPTPAAFRTRCVNDFWMYAQRRLEKFNGIPRHTFYLHLKESEWRFNLADQDPYNELLKIIERHPL
jgi:transposase-like protein